VICRLCIYISTGCSDQTDITNIGKSYQNHWSTALVHKPHGTAFVTLVYGRKMVFTNTGFWYFLYKRYFYKEIRLGIYPNPDRFVTLQRIPTKNPFLVGIKRFRKDMYIQVPFWNNSLYKKNLNNN
jgi:hypothetical protein